MTGEPLPPAARAEHLTEALRRSGVIGDARVREVVVESTRPTILSRIIRLRLIYDGAAPDAPASIIIKTALPERPARGRAEVAFYNEVAAAMSACLVPRCFEAHWDAETDAWHLLLEDLSDTHFIATVWPLPPTMEHCQAIIDTRAHFHATWWDDPRLGTSVGKWDDAEALAKFLQNLAERFARFFDRIGDELPRERRELYEQLLGAAPRLLARYTSHRHLTIVQGDAHVWNTFLPRDGGGDVRFFDWDGWRIDTATDDLAYMMAVHWYPDRRRRIERPLLDRYYTTLVRHGVCGYDLAALEDDYRHSVLWQMITPAWQATNNIPPVIWWNNLERVLLAVDDLGCRDLLL
jgi:Ecdysteroid kinase-like family